MEFMMAFAWSSVMLLLGVVLRAKVAFLQNMLVPSSVIAGVLGIIFINISEGIGISVGTTTATFTGIVNHLFTISFISITLIKTPEDNGNTTKTMVRGIVGLGVIWSLLYGLTPIIGAGVIYLAGQSTGMDLIYGMLIQFAFCQGPGQSVTYGTLFETFGWPNSVTVAVAFSVVGFIVAFAIGIPIAKWGIKKGLAKNCGSIDEAILKGYLKKEEQTAMMVKDTTCNSNIETLTYHFAIIGLCYLMAVGISIIFSYLPGFLGVTMSGLMFMNGIYAALIVKYAMKKMKLDFMLENTLQTKITSWTSDYLVVGAFMAVSIQIIADWLIPILILAVLTTAITFIICFYFGRRLGGSNDFERTLGIYGACTGTIPSGICLIRIIDPNFKTSTAIELGACNLVMLVSKPVALIIMAYASNTIDLWSTLGGLAFCCIAYLVTLKLNKNWGARSF